MSIKRKLILIGVCVIIIIVVFTVNIIMRVKEAPQKETEQAIAQVTSISRAEAFRLLSYLEYKKADREAAPTGIVYQKEGMSGWYDKYVNAVWKMGLIDSEVSISPEEALTYGSCKEMIDKLILKRPALQTVYEGLQFDFTKAEDKIPIEEFLELYEAILAMIPEEEQIWSRETLLVLGREVTEDNKDRMVTDQGKYYYQDAESYVMYLEEVTETEDKTTDLTSSNTTQESDQDPTEGTGAVDDNDAVSEEESEAEDTLTYADHETSLIDEYMDQGIHALVCGQEIIYITSVTTEKIVVHNVWIQQGEGLQVDTFLNGIDKTFTAQYKLSNTIEKVVGDITIENQKVVQISVKPDVVQGKVLRTGDDFIEIEGYGELPLEEDFRIYKIYGTLSVEPTGSILVGYENTDFIVSGGKISAALITESIKAENIRVLIRTEGFKDIYHSKIELTSDQKFTVSNGEVSDTYKAGENVVIQFGDDILSEGRITVTTTSGEGKIELKSIERSTGTPKYRGSIEIAEDENGLIIINELPLEEYLYAVIPSEMPTSYGSEALKVQAVCARSYAYTHLLSNSLSEYGAHVDDSSSYQVYNNIAENEDSILAVKDTYGKIVEYEGEVIVAYYFSTSCGHTATASNAWTDDTELPYLQSKLLLTEMEGEGAEAQNTAELKYYDLSSEDTFRSFLKAEDVTTYDSSFNWYRWKVTMNVKDMKKVIDAKLEERYNANPELILTKTSEDGEEEVYESIPVDTVGTIVDISVTKRESSGMVSEIMIIGSEKTILVKKEFNIRVLLAPLYDKVIRQDESEVENLTLLPSPFFSIERKEKSNKLSGIVVSGGGFGHGVGLSQNGVKALADTGVKYEDILRYFYEDTEIGFIYE